MKRARIRAADLARLKPELDQLYGHYNHAESVADPIEIARRYPEPADREVAAFCAAALAFGRVASVLQSVERLLAVMQPSPAAFLSRFDPEKDAALFAPLGHRWAPANSASYYPGHYIDDSYAAA